MIDISIKGRYKGMSDAVQVLLFTLLLFACVFVFAVVAAYIEFWFKRKERKREQEKKQAILDDLHVLVGTIKCFYEEAVATELPSWKKSTNSVDDKAD